MSKHRVRLDLAEIDLCLIEEVATIIGSTPKSVMRQFFQEIRSALTKNNSTVRLPAAWNTAWETVQQRNVATELQDSPIDVSVLHLSLKTNSGYEGVYQHPNPGRGFIARGREPGTNKAGHHLGLFPTAEQAAWARYEHYRKHGMPYGLKIEKLQEQLDEQLALIKDQSDMVGVSEYWRRAWALQTLVDLKIDVTPLEPNFKPMPMNTLLVKMDGPDPV